MRNDFNYFTAAAGLPYIPKVTPFSSDNLCYLNRWRHNAIHSELKDSATDSKEEAFASVVFTLDLNDSRCRTLTTLADSSGWLVFAMLTVATFPRSHYLLYAAVSDIGDWVDGLALEGLFDFATHVRVAEPPSNDIVRRLNMGLECHRQLSMAHWHPRRKQLLFEFDEKFGERYSDKVAKIEERLKNTRRKLHEEPSVESRRLLAEDRAELRKALLNAEATEGEAAKFMIRLQAEQPSYELRKLFTIEWSVKSASEHAQSRLAQKAKKRKR